MDPKLEEHEMPVFWVMGPDRHEVIYDFGSVPADQAEEAHIAATSPHGSTGFGGWSGSSKDRCLLEEDARRKYPNARVLRWNRMEWTEN